MEFMSLFYFAGLAKIGVKTALLNFNLRSKSLLHSVTVSEAKILIVGKGKLLCSQGLGYFCCKMMTKNSME